MYAAELCYKLSIESLSKAQKTPKKRKGAKGR